MTQGDETQTSPQGDAFFECPAGVGMGSRPAEVLGGAFLGLGWTLRARRAACWEVRPIHGVANE